MDKVASNEALTVREEAEGGSAPINSLIKQYVTLRESLEKQNRKVQKWKNDTSTLLNSNSNIESKLHKSEQSVSDVNADISANMRLCGVEKQEVKNLQSARADLCRRQWDKTLTEIGNYADDFSRRITEYSRNILMRNIESHEEECKKVRKDLELLKEELNIMRDKFDADCIQANVDVGDLPNINSVMSAVKMVNNNLTHGIRLKEDLLNKIENKIKQSNAAINAINKIKGKANMF